MEKKWYVYLIECLDGSYYTGVTIDVDRREKEHAQGKGSTSSKYVKAKGFKKLLASKLCKNKQEAYKEEYRIKQLTKHEKLEAFSD